MEELSCQEDGSETKRPTTPDKICKYCLKTPRLFRLHVPLCPKNPDAPAEDERPMMNWSQKILWGHKLGCEQLAKGAVDKAAVEAGPFNQPASKESWISDTYPDTFTDSPEDNDILIDGELQDIQSETEAHILQGNKEDTIATNGSSQFQPDDKAEFLKQEQTSDYGEHDSSNQGLDNAFSSTILKTEIKEESVETEPNSYGEENGQEASCEKSSKCNREKKLRCKYCQFCTDRSSRLRDHERIHTGEKPFVCKLCDFRCARQGTYNLHSATEHKFPCKLCQLSFTTRNKLKVHEMTHNGREPFKCEICSKEFHSKIRLGAHRITMKHIKAEPAEKNISKPDRQYKHSCKYCDYRCDNISCMKKHEMKHTGERPYQCEYCEHKSKSKTELSYHQAAKHATGEPWKCDVCKASFTTNWFLKQHRDEEHYGVEKKEKEKEKPVCAQCESTFDCKTDLHKHMKSVHNNMGEYQCDQCPYQSWTKKLLNRHIVDQHEITTRQYHCQFCGKSFKRKGEVKKHERIHSSEKPFKCEYCNQQFRTKYPLSLHTAAKHGSERPYQCELCPKKYATISALSKHKVTHSSTKPYECNTCGYTCTTKQLLDVHNRIHTGERPYQCELCPKTFKHRSAFVTHKLVHTGEKPYSCSICSQRFRHIQAMQSHESRHKD